MLLVCRFTPGTSPEVQEAFLERARVALALLADQPGCRGLELGTAVEEPGRWVLVASFDSVTAYRRALTPFDVREHVVPWLSEALADEPAAYERRLSASVGDGPFGGPLAEHPSLLSRDDPRER